MHSLTNIQLDLLGAIPLTARRVLEVESGSADLAAAFKLRAPGAHWTATVSDTAAAAPSPEGVDVWLRGSLESSTALPWPAWRQGFDCIVLGDVLDRLAQPAVALRRLADCLAPGGVVAATVSNSVNWRQLSALLRGRRRDADEPTAALGRRMFSEQDLFDLARAAELEARKLVGRQPSVQPAGFEAFEKAAGGLLTWLGPDAEGAARRLRTSHYVLRATRKTARSAPRMVVAVLAMAPTCADVRTRLPLEAMATLADVDVAYMERQGTLPELPRDQPKVLVVQRQLISRDGQWLRVVQGLRAKGWAVVAEWDDHPDLFDPTIRARFDEAPWGSVRAADAAQTSTEALAGVLRAARDDDRVVVFDNRLLELPPLAALRSHAAAPWPVRVSFGAINRTADGLAMVAALAPVLARWRDTEVEVIHDRAVFDALQHPRKRFVPLIHSYRDYHAHLSQCDIALLPLSPSLPHECKSDVKWVECSAHGMACIASPTVYARSIVDGQTGLLADSPESFAEGLERLLADADLRRRLGRQAREAVAAGRMLAQDVERRIAWYEALWTDCMAQRAGSAATA